MAYFERVRDVVSEPFSPEIIRQRTASGWQMVSIEWRRELPDSEAPPEGGFSEDIPYGLRISTDCKRLEIEPKENDALLMMELLVQDFSLLAHCESDLERVEGLQDARWSTLESGGGLQYDPPAHRGRSPILLDRRVGQAAQEVLSCENARGLGATGSVTSESGRLTPGCRQFCGRPGNPRPPD